VAVRHVRRGAAARVRLKALTASGRLPFVFEASGTETHITNGYDPEPRARRIFGCPQPASLARTVRAAAETPEGPTWRGKVLTLPELDTDPLRPAHITAIRRRLMLRKSRKPLWMAGSEGRNCRCSLLY